MPGDDRVRSCPACDKEVHDFEALTRDEAAALIAARGPDLCGRVRRNADGTIVTSGEAPARRGPRGDKGFHLRSLMALIAWIAAALGILRFLAGQTTVTAGRICVPPRPSASPEPGMPNGEEE